MSLCCLVFCLTSIISSVFAQWKTLLTTNEGPSPRRGHSLVTYTDEYNNDIIILFGGRSQYFRNCSFINNWNWTECGDHYHEKLVDTTIILSSSNILYPNCSLNCSSNGWCHYDETISNSYCICYDDYRGDICQYREFQQFNYDVWYLNITTKTWIEYDFLNRSSYAYVDDWPWPSQRYEHSAIISNNLMIIYGGYSPKCLDYCDDIWVWNITNNNNQNKWIGKHRNNYSLPNNGTGGKRWQHIAFLLNNNMYVFGGHRFGKYMNDVVQLNLNTFEWKLMNNSNNTKLPPTRLGHAYSSSYIHGGYHSTSYLPNNNNNNNNPFNDSQTYWLRDLWKFEIDESLNSVYWINISYNGLNETDPPNEILTELNRWYKIPFPRTDHNIINIPNSNIIYLYGGYTSSEWFNDIWRFDLNTNLWIKHSPPYYNNNSESIIPARSGHQSTYSPSINSIILFGGYGNDNKISGITIHTIYYNDLYIFRLNGCKGYENNNECLKNNKHGICKNQFCFCNDNYFGIGCEYNMCPNSKCIYNNHTWLPQCIFCNGNGICNNGTCICNNGYTGDDCTQLQCLNDCSNHGNCTEISSGTVECICEYGYESSDCSLHSCLNDCSNRGICDHSTGICNCDECPESGRKYSSPDCAKTIRK